MKEAGLVLDYLGLVLDGRNRLAACQIAGVDPEYETYDGDPVAYVLSSNERRHMTLPERAASVALTLATNGKRENGKWAYGAVSAAAPANAQDSGRSAWSEAMRGSGLVLDYLGEAIPAEIRPTSTPRTPADGRQRRSYGLVFRPSGSDFPDPEDSHDPTHENRVCAPRTP